MFPRKCDSVGVSIGRQRDGFVDFFYLDNDETGRGLFEGNAGRCFHGSAHSVGISIGRRRDGFHDVFHLDIGDGGEFLRGSL